MKTFCKKIILTITAIILLCHVSFAQEKRETTILLSFHKNADNSKIVLAKVKAKDDTKRFVTAANVQINFYVTNGNEQQLLKKVFTNRQGTATLELPDVLPLDEESYFDISAKIENDSFFEDSEEQIRHKEAKLTFKLHSEDTMRLVTATVTEKDRDGNEIPGKEIEVTFYVQRLFGRMPVAEEYAISTDDNGEATLVFPNDIPGDTLGNLTIIAQIEDNEQYGNLENEGDAQWGIPLLVEKDPFPRALWGQRAPIAMIITFAILFGLVWSFYFFVFYQLRKISKEKLIISKN